jgi:hypothetical protein
MSPEFVRPPAEILQQKGERNQLAISWVPLESDSCSLADHSSCQDAARQKNPVETLGEVGMFFVAERRISHEALF